MTSSVPDEPPWLGCPSCGLVSLNLLAAAERADREQHCSRCGHVLRARKPMSVQRTWALVIAAGALYVPANLLPVMTTATPGQRDEHTLLGGIHELWTGGQWGLSIIVFIASIAVPVLKICVLALLAASTSRAPAWRRLERAKLYRLVEAIGHWSMLDVYVVVLLGATVRFGAIGNVSAAPGMLAFCAVVVLTMLATYSFDPRLIWQDRAPAMTDSPPDPSVPPPGTPPPPVTPPPSPSPAVADVDLPQPVVTQRKRWNVSLVWLLPAVAIAIGASLLVRTVFLTGPSIEIEFTSADGIEAGRTELRYKEVVIGKVRSVGLRDDRQRVVVGVQLARSAGSFAVEDSSFWVVRPRVGTAGVTGLGTLLSGAYIATDAGVSKNQREYFVGLESPPLVLRGEPGVVFVLRASDLGSLDVGSPVFYRRTKVGRVVAYALDPQRDELSIKVFVEAAYQRLVTRETRFWNASGIDLTLNASGLTVTTQTLASVLAGGLAFESPPGPTRGAPAAPDTVFTLFADRRAALAPPDGNAVAVRMVFDQTARGLVEGAAIDLLGIEIGRVTSVALRYDAERKRFPIEVVADIFPRRLGSVREALLRQQGGNGGDQAVLQALVATGLRAQMRTGNLLTGQQYIGLDFVGKQPAKVVASADGVLVLPTAPGTLSEIQPQIAEIVQKVSRIPFEEIGTDLRSMLSRAGTAISQLTPEAQKAMAEVQKTLTRAQASLDSLDRNVTDPNAPVQRQLEDTLVELQRATRSLRVLADYLQQHPESLLRGKPPDAAVPRR